MSRRQADELIEKGSVTVNGKVARLGQQVSPSDNVAVNQQATNAPKALRYIALNKPIGSVCSRRKQDIAETIYTLLPDNLHHLKPVGRLDKNSSGLLLLTNDGDFAHRMTHPSFKKKKVYQIELDKPLSENDFERITKTGVDIGELKPSKFQLVASPSSSVASESAAQKPNDWRLKTKSWSATLHQGRNRQIHRTFGALGYNVIKLHRTTFGDYSLSDLTLASGAWHDVKMLD